MSTRQSKKQARLPEIVEQSFSGYTNETRATLLRIRALIYEIKQEDPEIGEIQEVLRWGELSYLTEKPKTGSMIRLSRTKSGEPAVFFHCGTSLVETFRSQYSHIFDFEKNRAMIIRMPIDETVAELTHCLQQALRYKLDKT